MDSESASQQPSFERGRATAGRLTGTRPAKEFEAVED